MHAGKPLNTKQMLVFLLVLTVLIYSLIWAGTTGKIAGTIKDSETGEPLPGVNVMIVGTTIGAATDAEGQYFIINVRPGNYDLQATMMGFERLTKTGIRVSTDHTTPCGFYLETHDPGRFRSYNCSGQRSCKKRRFLQPDCG
jgi:hypothetical protein